MSSAGYCQETTTKEDTKQHAAIKQTMVNEETPGWAQQLLSEVVGNSVKDLKKETRVIE